MTHKERNDFIESEFNKIMELSRTKGVEYANSDVDANNNFKEIASKLGLDEKIVLWVYATKHFQAITSYMKNGETLSEPIDGRIHDLILYLFILLSMESDERLALL